MKHILKNKGISTLYFGNVIIIPNDSYMMYDSDLDMYGNFFKSFKENFTTEFQEDFEYIEDSTIKTLDDFYTLLVSLFNDTKLNDYADTQNFRIYSLLNKDKKHLAKNPTILPSSINYKIDISKLHCKYQFKKGILIKAEYFQNCEVSQDAYGLDVYVYSLPVLKCEFEYHVDNSSYISYRYTRRYWAYCDDTYSSEYKEGTKYYSKFDARNEALRRRNNIVNDVIMTAGGLLLYTEDTITSLSSAEDCARPLLGILDDDIDKFNKGISDPIINTLSNLDASLYLETTYAHIGNWLNNLVPNGGGITIRQLILSKLSEGTLVPNEIITI